MKSVTLDYIQDKFSVSSFWKTLSDAVDVQDDVQAEDKWLDEAEVALGDHVTGGVVHGWRQVEKRLGEVLFEGKRPDCPFLPRH